jgi:uncharacterized oligopeptide transporter (OPT) family protein
LGKGTTKGFTIRGIVIAMAMSMVLCVVGQYIAISLGMMPWSTVLVAIVVLGLISALSRVLGSHGVSMDEVVVTQAAGSVGILIGAGVAFVLPGIWYMSEYSTFQIPIWTVGLLAAVGGLLGVIISNSFREEFVDVENLPFPAGKAAGDVLKAGDEGGHNAKLVLLVGSITGLFVLVRDRLLPQTWNPLTLKFLEPRNIFISIRFSLLSFAGGFLGSVFAWIYLMPTLIKSFAAKGAADPFVSATVFRIGVGTGIVIGSGICFLLIGLGPKIPQLASAFKRVFTSRSMRLPILAVVIAIGVLYAYDVLSIPSALFAVLGVFVMTPLAAKTTGETNVDPMEIFGILVFLFASAILVLPVIEAFYVICIVTIGTGVAGDIMHDYKTAKMLGTDPFQITKMQILAVIGASLVAGLGLAVLFNAYGVGGESGIGSATGTLPAPQSTIVHLFVTSITNEGGLPNPNAFWGGLIFGFALQTVGAVIARLGKKITISAFTFGIGVFLPMQVSIPLFVGGLAKLAVDLRGTSVQKGDLVAAAMLGGEGIVGFILAVQTILPVLLGLRY